MHHATSEDAGSQVTQERSRSLPVLLLLVLSIALNAALLVCFSKLHRWDRERVMLREEIEKGISIEWKLRSGETIADLPSLWEMLAGAHPIELNVGSRKGGTEMARIQEIAAIFAHHGRLEDLNVYVEETAEVESWMKHIGAQPNLLRFTSYSTGFSDEASTFLAGFPAVESITIQSSNFTGGKFPPLPALIDVDLTDCNITPAGLRRIMACPSVRYVGVYPDRNPSPELLQAYRDLKKSHPAVRLDGLE